MPTLVANSPQASIRRIELRLGINTVGRAEGNHHVIPEASISTRHCELIVDDGSVSVRDLGSTNGTFIEDRPVQQEALAHGQRIRFGGVEYFLEASETVGPARPGDVRVHLHSAATEPAIVPPPMGHTAHDSIAALAATVTEAPGFHASLPGAFAYPFKRNGIILLLIGSILFVVLEFLSSVSSPSVGGRIRVTRFSILITVITVGYLYAFMQKVIVHSAQGEDGMPDFPELGEWWSDILQPFLFLLGVSLVSFGPGLLVLIFSGENIAQGILGMAMLGFGALYFPMALLAVAVSDNFIGLSPHIVIPSMLKVFPAYIVALLMIGTLFGIRLAGGLAVNSIPLEMIPIKIFATLVMGFISLYLLTVNMRVLGLLFRSYRARLGWLG